MQTICEIYQRLDIVVLLKAKYLKFVMTQAYGLQVGETLFFIISEKRTMASPLHPELSVFTK